MKANFETGMKYCPHCKEERPIAEFSKDKSKVDGLKQFCKKYQQEQDMKLRNTRKEKHLKSPPKLTGLKYCSVCEKKIPKVNFLIIPETRDGLSRYCKKHHNLYQKTRYYSFTLEENKIENKRRYIQKETQILLRELTI